MKYTQTRTQYLKFKVWRYLQYCFSIIRCKDIRMSFNFFLWFSTNYLSACLKPSSCQYNKVTFLKRLSLGVGVRQSRVVFRVNKLCRCWKLFITAFLCYFEIISCIFTFIRYLVIIYTKLIYVVGFFSHYLFGMMINFTFN